MARTRALSQSTVAEREPVMNTHTFNERYSLPSNDRVELRGDMCSGMTSHQRLQPLIRLVFHKGERRPSNHANEWSELLLTIRGDLKIFHRHEVCSGL
jgi:hypothetical protein